MIKKTTFFVLGAVALLLGSCVENNPKEIYNLPDPDEITGPRILKTVKTNSGLVSELYQSTYGILNSVQRGDVVNNAISQTQDIQISYIGSRISHLLVSGTFAGITGTGRAELIPIYNSTTGRISSVTNIVYEGTTPKYREVTTVEYDTTGKPILLFKVHATASTSLGTTVYTNAKQIIDVIAYNGNNVASIEQTTNEINPSTGIVTSSTFSKIAFSDYDWHPNLYKTISKQYLMLLGTMMYEYYYGFSENNAKTKTTTITSGVQTVENYTYTYDSQAYPISNGTHTYTYQPVP